MDETNANATRVWECETPEACLGGADSACRTGHEGVLCASCKEGYARGLSRLCAPPLAAQPLANPNPNPSQP